MHQAEQNPKSKIIPVMICYTPVAIIYYLFAYGPYSYKPAPSFDCWAHEMNNIPYFPNSRAKFDPPRGYVNVSMQFDVVIKWGFLNALLAIFISIPIGAHY